MYPSRQHAIEHIRGKQHRGTQDHLPLPYSLSLGTPTFVNCLGCHLTMEPFLSHQNHLPHQRETAWNLHFTEPYSAASEQRILLVGGIAEHLKRSIGWQLLSARLTYNGKELSLALDCEALLAR